MYNDWYSLYLEQQETNTHLEAIEDKLDNISTYVVSGEKYIEDSFNHFSLTSDVLLSLFMILLLWLVFFGLLRK